LKRRRVDKRNDPFGPATFRRRRKERENFNW
jgi:hypothetical protein